jgi:predicted ATP-dependent serine protease
MKRSIKNETRVCRFCTTALNPGKITCSYCGVTDFGLGASERAGKNMQSTHDDGIRSLASVETDHVERYVTGLADDVWGYPKHLGIALPSVTILGGRPGFGKSTFCLQYLSRLAMVRGPKGPPLYVGAEEASEQIKDRASRLKIPNMAEILLLPLEAQQSGKALDLAVYDKYNPCAVVIDSVQGYSDNQDDAVEIANAVKVTAAIRKIPHIVIGQVTKEGDFEGSEKLQHACDTLLMGELADIVTIEDEEYEAPKIRGQLRDEPFRILVSKKNRFAPINECYFTMAETGLVPFTGKERKKK